MENFVAVGERILNALQLGGLVAAAICFAIAGYHFFIGGHDGGEKAKKRLIGGVVGLVILFGAMALATLVKENVSF